MTEELEIALHRWCQSFVDYGPDDATTCAHRNKYCAELRKLDDSERREVMEELLRRPEYREVIRASAKLTDQKYKALATIARHYLGPEGERDAK